MTKLLPRPRPDRWFLLLALLLAARGFAAVTPTEWQYRQPLDIPEPGLVKVELTAATFDTAQPDLADLRVVDATGQELPYLLDRDRAPRGPGTTARLNPKSFNLPPTADNLTQLVIETGTTDSLDAVELETPAPFFLKAAHVEISADGARWQSLGASVPVFRQFGAEQLRLELGRQKAAWVRVTLDNFRSRPVTFAGATLLPAPTPGAEPALTPLGARIVRREEFSGETLLTVALDGRNVPLAALAFDTGDPLFMRRVTVGVREMRGAVAGERLIATGTIYRVAVDGTNVRQQLQLPVEFTPPTRELLVHIHNGDSPPLALSRVMASQHAVNLLFFARQRGSLQLLTGNAQATAPRYDLATFAGDLRGARPTTMLPGALAAMPDYHAPEVLGPPLPDMPLAGTPLDTAKWQSHRAIAIARAGVQELELDPAALAVTRPDFADLRLIRNGNQIPYVLEQPALFRALALTPVAAPDDKRPSVSRSRVALPQARLPLRRLVLASPTPLFQRQIRIYEEYTGVDGGVLQNTVAAGNWSRTPEPGRPETCTFELSGPTRTDTLWIETDNGDNPAIELGAMQAVYPVVRLIFKTGETDGFTLAAGNPATGAPRYDLGLVAGKLLTAPRNVATLAAPPAGATHGGGAGGLRTGYVFWGALGLVVIALLFSVAKLLPKPPAGK